MLLRDRREEIERAGIRPFAASRDSPWSHVSWSMTLGVDGVPLLSDWNGEAMRGFGVAVEVRGMRDVAARSAFLIDGEIVKSAWMLESDMPDIDAVIAAAKLP